MDIAATTCMKRFSAQTMRNARMMIDTTIIHVGYRFCVEFVKEVLSRSMRDDSAVRTPLLVDDSDESTLPDLDDRINDGFRVDEFCVNPFTVDLHRPLLDHPATV